MRRFIRTLTVAFICGILVVPVMEAQRQPGTNGSRPATTATSSTRQQSPNRTAPQRNNNNNPGRPSGSRPSSSSGSSNSAPSVDRGTDNNRNQGGYKATPPRNNRPSTAPQQGNRPSGTGNNVAPQPRPKPQPGYTHNAPPQSRPQRVAPPARPHRLPMRPYTRPLPPPSFRPYQGCPVIHGILGLSFGTTLSLSVDYLYNNGYSVDGYGNDVVYLRNVSAMSFVWSDATLYYSSGGLTASRFSYSTSYYDVSRYNTLYSTLASQYGNPVDFQSVNGGFVATWFGYDNGYISLEYGQQYSSGGSMRYYTTLTYGN